MVGDRRCDGPLCLNQHDGKVQQHRSSNRICWVLGVCVPAVNMLRYTWNIWKTLKKNNNNNKKNPHTECSVVVLFFQNTGDLSVAAGEGPQGPFYWQAQGRKNTISWQKTSQPEQTPVSSQTYKTSHQHGPGLLSIYLCCTQEMSSPSSLIRHVCMQAVAMHVITLCGVFICLSPQERESLLPCELQCVFRGRTWIFKTQPWAHRCPCSSPAD